MVQIITKGSKKQFETHHIVVRWGAFCPYSNNLNEDMDDSRVEINMFGVGHEAKNPENKLIFKRPDTNMQDEYSSRMAPGRISFNLRKGNHVRGFLPILLVIISSNFIS